MPLAGSTYSMGTLVQLVQSRIDAANAAAASRATWLRGVAEYQALDKSVTPVLRALRQYVINVHGPDSPILADFGFAPPKKTPLTAEQRVAKAQKAAATRKARGTLGPKQKRGVKGAVTGVTVTPIVAGPPVAPATSSATTPAPAGPSATAAATHTA